MGPVDLAPPAGAAASIVDIAGALAGELTPKLPAAVIDAVRHSDEQGLTVLLVLDGVGCAQVDRHVANGALASSRVTRLASVFPSSTAPAITSLLSARNVGQHGNPGWFMRDPSSGQVIRTLPMDFREPSRSGDKVDPAVWQWSPWTAKVAVPSFSLQPAQIADSIYSRHGFSASTRIGYNGLDELKQQFSSIVDTAGKKFVYVYVPDFDSISHDCGWQSDEALACLQRLDQLFEELAQVTRRANGSVFVVADHGFTDISQDKQFDIADFAAIAGLLQAPLTGEPRAAFCFVQPEDSADFCQLVGSQMADICQVADNTDLIDNGWFGSQVDSQFSERIGTHTLILNDGYAVSDRLEGERRHRMNGMHGGISSDETWVPLCISS